MHYLGGTWPLLTLFHTHRTSFVTLRVLRATPRVTPPLESRITSTLPSHILLEKIFEGYSWQTFGENITQLLNSINFQKLNSPLSYFFTKPNGSRGILFAAWSKLWWKRLGQNWCSCIILTNQHFHCYVTDR